MLAARPLVVFVVELALFAAAVSALVAAGQATLGVLLGVAYAVDRAVLAAQNRSLAIDQ